MVSPRDAALPAAAEVVFHHVDLDSGFGFDAVPAAIWCADFVDDAVARLRATQGAPAVELRADEGDVWTLGEPTAYVSGSLADLLLWLARRDPTGPASDGELPGCPGRLRPRASRLGAVSRCWGPRAPRGCRPGARSPRPRVRCAP